MCKILKKSNRFYDSGLVIKSLFFFNYTFSNILQLDKENNKALEMLAAICKSHV